MMHLSYFCAKYGYEIPKLYLANEVQYHHLGLEWNLIE